MRLYNLSASRCLSAVAMSLILGLPFSVLAQVGTLEIVKDGRLKGLYEATLNESPLLQLRALDAERAKASTDIAVSRKGVQLSWTLGASQTEYVNAATSQSGFGYRSVLSVRKLLHDASAEKRIGATKSLVSQRELEEKAVRAAIAQDLTERYLQVLEAEAEIAALMTERVSAVRQADRLAVMRERQLARATEVAEINAYVLALNTKLIDAQSQRRMALDRLTDLTGKDVQSVVPLNSVALPANPQELRTTITQLAILHPRLLSLQHAAQVNRLTLEAITLEARPTVAAVASHTNTDQGFDNVLSGRYRATNLGLELRVPIYEGGRLDAAMRDAIAAVKAAEFQIDLTRREIERELRKASLAEQAARARIASTSEEVSAMEQALNAQEKGFALGVGTLVELLEANKRLHRSRTSLDKAKLELARSIIGQRIHSGAFEETDLALWDAWFGAQR